MGADAQKPDYGEIKHPTFVKMLSSWQKFRYVYEGGTDFIDEYLHYFSEKEDQTDFSDRKAVTYNPAYAKAAIVDVKNSIFLRMCDISREGMPDSLKSCIGGQLMGVDLDNRSLNAFVGGIILPELLSIGKVGIWVDNHEIEEGSTKADTVGLHPYMYHYTAENIRSWRIDPKTKEFTVLLLTEEVEEIDETTQLVTGTQRVFKLVSKTDEGIIIQYFNKDNTAFEDDLHKNTVLKINTIPFVVLELPYSLLSDVADHQTV
jgi:hypothetical protein